MFNIFGRVTEQTIEMRRFALFLNLLDDDLGGFVLEVEAIVADDDLVPQLDFEGAIESGLDRSHGQQKIDQLALQNPERDQSTGEDVNHSMVLKAAETNTNIVNKFIF